MASLFLSSDSGSRDDWILCTLKHISAGAYTNIIISPEGRFVKLWESDEAISYQPLAYCIVCGDYL